MGIRDFPQSFIKMLLTVILLQFPLYSQITVDINSGNPSAPFPQFLPYDNPSGRLGNLATHNAEGVTHAEMEKTIREAYQIMMNRASKPGGGVGGIDYIKFKSDCDCTEGDGYAMLAAAAMADKTTFDGLWLWIHDHAMHNVKKYSDCTDASPGYEYTRLPGWQNTAGSNSVTDGDVDMGLALLSAYYQWGEFMGINDACGNPISYKQEAIEFLKALTDTFAYTRGTNKNYISGDIGLDGYIKSGDTWTEMTDWASDTTRSGFLNIPEFKGPQQQYIDYAAPAYFHQFADFLAARDSSKYAWNIKQFRRCEASSDWLVGQMLAADPAMIPFAGKVSMSSDNKPTFSNYNQGEDFRLAWRTILNYVWHGKPLSTWDPVSHQATVGLENSFERDIGLRYAKFLWDSRQSPWNNPCIKCKSSSISYWGPSVILNSYTLLGKPDGTFFLNWVPGTGSPSAVAAQDYNLMAELYRYCEIEFAVEMPVNGYLTSVPKYFHGWFRLLGLLVLSGNYHSPSDMQPSANMKVYLDVNKTYTCKGDEITYTVDYRNYGSLDAKNVIITDTLDNDLSVVSCTGGGSFDASSHVVSWQIGTVPGFKSASGIGPTTGEVSLKVTINTVTQKQYRNRVSIKCDNGSGWTSNEYPNRVSTIMKRNFVDVLEDTGSAKNMFPSLHGGRSGVHFSIAKYGESQSSYLDLSIRMFHDAQESYINCGSYRLSYFLYDTIRNGIKGENDNGIKWVVNASIKEGVKNLKIIHENLTPGSDSHGKWNQRFIFQFSDSLPSDTDWSSTTTINHHLDEYRGMTDRIHRGMLNPLYIDVSINSSDLSLVQWDDDWSWNANNNKGLDSVGYPVTPDFTDPSPDNQGIAVTNLDEKSCTMPVKTFDNVLIEEWDGYTWRRVFGNVFNVTVKSSLPNKHLQKSMSLQHFGNGVIKYSLSTSGQTRLQILDIQGRVIKMPVNEKRPAGSYTVRLNSGEFNSSMYILRLVCGKNTLTKKISIVK